MIHILMRNEVSYSEFAELARQAYVDVAYDHFSIPSRKTTHSRVSVLTGLSRREVMRLSQQREEEVSMKKGKVNRTSRVITGWLKDRDFLDENDQPLSLPLRGEVSFETLVSRYGGDTTMGSILDELKRIEAIEIDSNDVIRLLSHTYIPQTDEAEKVGILSMCATDLLETGVHNLDHADGEARFQRQVVYQSIPESVAEEFKQYSNKKSLDLLLDYNRWLDSHPGRTSPGANESTQRVGVGIYFFENES